MTPALDTRPSPGEQLYTWFVAHSRTKQVWPVWPHLTAIQQGIFELWAIHMGRWACGEGRSEIPET